MLKRLKDRLKFRLERMLLRGAHFRLLVMAGLIGLVSLTAGLLARGLELGFSDAGEAVWWAFLRLTDPGYLGDDEGVVRRIISTVVTVLGYVIFMGALIAIMTQWLSQTIRNLESGFTPIAQNDHVLILGWTNRTASVVRELVLSEERVKRFLRRHGSSRLHVVVLAEDVSAERMNDLRDELGTDWDPRQITLRSGTPLRVEHLHRVDFLNASAILLPGADFAYGGAEATDTRTIKTLMSIANHAHEEGQTDLPLLVTEIFDTRKVSIARRAYDGPIEILASDSMISRLIAQNVRHRGLSHVYAELLAHGAGNEIYVREHPQFMGARFQDLGEGFPDAVLLGAVRPHGKDFRPVLNPPDGFVLEGGDRLVLMARSYQGSTPDRDDEPQPLSRGKQSAQGVETPPKRRVLLLGWSHKVTALLREFDNYGSETFGIDILSAVPIPEREERLERYDLHLKHVTVCQLAGDYTVPSDLQRAEPGSYDNVVLMGSDWVESGEASDARTLLGYLLLQDLLPEGAPRPGMVIELMDADNVSLFRKRSGEVLVSPLMLSHILAQVALRRELRSVFDELFGPGGAEIFFRPVAQYEVVGQDTAFSELQETAALRGEIALGVRIHAEEDTATGGVYLNPDRTQQWHLVEEDEIVVLTTYS